MRSPDSSLLPESDRLTVLPLDVTDAGSIARAVEAAGPLDALVNNAGVGMLNVVEGVPVEKIRELVETNLIGTIAMVKAVLPQMRERGSGVIVNVSASVTMRPLPALSVYSASKAAVNAFTESLSHEAALHGIRARLVLPGAAPSTSFGKNAMSRMGADYPAAYQVFIRGNLAELHGASEFTEAESVAHAAWRAVTDPDAPIKIPAGDDAETWFREGDTAAA